jgi:uncharacterized protein (TIGR03067 family)
MFRPAGLLVVISFLATASVRAEPPGDLDQLRGKWKPVEANLGGNVIDAMLLAESLVTFDGDKYTIAIKEREERGTLVLGDKAMPKTMDTFPTSGDNNGKTFLCIYRFDGDASPPEKLTICYSLTPGVRPESFEPASNTLLLVKYERVKE